MECAKTGVVVLCGLCKYWVFALLFLLEIAHMHSPRHLCCEPQRRDFSTPASRPALLEDLPWVPFLWPASPFWRSSSHIMAEILWLSQQSSGLAPLGLPLAHVGSSAHLQLTLHRSQYSFLSAIPAGVTMSHLLGELGLGLR